MDAINLQSYVGLWVQLRKEREREAFIEWHVELSPTLNLIVVAQLFFYSQKIQQKERKEDG